MSKLHLSPPWETYYDYLELLFEEDEDVQIVYDSLDHKIKIYVEEQGKAYALSNLLPKKKTFGNVELTITIIPPNDFSFIKEIPIPDDRLFEAAFAGNPIVSYICTRDGVFKAKYIVFVHEVVQFYNDDLSDINGVCSTLYQDIAKKVFENRPEGVFFCTDINEGETEIG